MENSNNERKREPRYYYAPNTQSDIDAAEGYKMDFANNFDHGIPEHRKNGFLDGCRYKAHQLNTAATEGKDELFRNFIRENSLSSKWEKYLSKQPNF